MDGYYSNKIIENNNFIEHAKASIVLPFDTCFKNVVIMNYHDDAKKFQNARKLIFRKLIKGTE